jgi:catalase
VHLAAHERLRQPHLHVDQRRGEKFWIKYHFKTDQGIEFFTQDEADQMASVDTDHHQRDLFEHIAAGRYPSGRYMEQVAFEPNNTVPGTGLSPRQRCYWPRDSATPRTARCACTT